MQRRLALKDSQNILGHGEAFDAASVDRLGYQDGRLFGCHRIGFAHPRIGQTLRRVPGSGPEYRRRLNVLQLPPGILLGDRSLGSLVNRLFDRDLRGVDSSVRRLGLVGRIAGVASAVAANLCQVERILGLGDD